ncbi:MAG: alpha/beta hydrolase [Deltaproteobacteria bacterium]|nr:alpha/beta hydrolase [Deltaproteobacteria bacterium]
MGTDIPHGGPGTALLDNGIRLVYDTFGNPSGAPLLLIQGLSWQMVMWDETFCGALAERGYFVIRFDNRDIGQSTHMDHAGIPGIARLLVDLAAGKPVEVPYLLSDMAGDSFGLLDHLGISSAHVVGMSMGGMIGQTMALTDPDRVRSLTSMSSTTGAPGLPPPTPEALRVLSTPPPTDRGGFTASFLATWRILNGTRFPVDEERVLRYAEETFERGIDPAGIVRQIAAINASGSRREELKSLTVPTLVIHGSADPLLRVECGIDTARAVPGAKLKIIEGMGHALPVPVWGEIIDAIADHAR